MIPLDQLTGKDFIKAGERLQPLPWLPEPCRSSFKASDRYFFDADAYEKAMQAYQEHLTACAATHFPYDPSLMEKESYVLGRDFEVKPMYQGVFVLAIADSVIEGCVNLCLEGEENYIKMQVPETEIEWVAVPLAAPTSQSLQNIQIIRGKQVQQIINAKESRVALAAPTQERESKEVKCPSTFGKSEMITYIYDFAWHYGRLWHVGDAEKIKAAIGEKFMLPEEYVEQLEALPTPAPKEKRNKAHEIIELLTEKPYEYIICAAIHFNDGKTYEHQPKGIESGFVIAGRRHHNCYRTLQVIGESVGLEGIVRKQVERIDRDHQGFLTNTNRYVDRKEGMRIAKAAKQLLNPKLHEDSEDAILISEDLY